MAGRALEPPNLEYPGLLLESAHVAEDEGDVLVFQARNRGHLPEIPVVLPDADFNGEKKGYVGVVIRVVYAVQERGALLTSPRLRTVAFRAIFFIGGLPLRDRAGGGGALDEAKAASR